MSDDPKRGDVYWVSLDPTIGSEVKKTRPGLVISNDIGNKHSKRVIIVPLTSTIHKIYPFEVRVDLSKGPGKAMLDQIRTVDKQRLREKICYLPSEAMREIDRVLKFVLALS